MIRTAGWGLESIQAGDYGRGLSDPLNQMRRRVAALFCTLVGWRNGGASKRCKYRKKTHKDRHYLLRVDC